MDFFAFINAVRAMRKLQLACAFTTDPHARKRLVEECRAAERAIDAELEVRDKMRTPTLFDQIDDQQG